MAKPTTVKEAIKAFETEKMVKATDESKVQLYGLCPPIEKMDATLSTLKACKHLALSSNNIEKISSLSGMDNLVILSLGRNLIKKIENLDGVADTLEELWLSYNQITSLSNIDKLTKLKVLYVANNKIAAYSELEKLSANEALEELQLRGNPVYEAAKEGGATPDSIGSAYRIEVLKRLPNLKKLDGIPIDADERDAAAAAGAE
mmetsp:Transcript_30936/g.100749  ORF Transcript_30936/g.100749 Transcript_30936/m.100749 type:complete len:204 (+) Transcript_30936:76-687(+)|eukprot:CAMPEP_0170133718 /NCGR_PEP_ID=MMETSP0033_2-20121228/1499_1 /TAXON_ID=195969 /ORGANISM="Dolichomastix tenuilepis, Strain CCMP3274" /LENGTH=203 /DNA_ID=CAMNT_0010369241 /DNA_START=70 /DNA_END=681 /DNA_ORIENTATION=+